MNAPRKKNVVSLPDSPEMSGWIGQVKKHLNTALTVLLLIAAVAMFVRWRMQSAEIARQGVANELVNARNLVSNLREYRLPSLRAQDLLSWLTQIENGANASISNVLNSSDATVKMRADALVLRGDLYWSLANFPPLPGASTQPSLALNEDSDALLQKAWDSYQEVIKNSTYADQHEELTASHLGVAAIAEDRHDWTAAESELNAVANDASALAVAVDLAKVQLSQLPDMKKKLYIAPPTGASQPVVPTTTPAATTQDLSVENALKAATQPVNPLKP